MRARRVVAAGRMTLASRQALVACAAAGALACGGEPVATAPSAAKTLTPVATLATTSAAGSTVGTWSVKVTDSAGAPVRGALVTFRVTIGGGRVAPSADTTASDGTAATTFTAGTQPGVNEISASTPGVAPLKSTQVTTAAGASRTLTVGTRAVRFSATQDSSLVAFTPRDTFGNAVTGSVSFVSRNPALVTVTNAGTQTAHIRVASRPGQTWVVASFGAATDSVPVSVLDGSSTVCAFLAAPTALGVGETLTFEGSATACVKTATHGEYVLVAHYNTTTSNALVSIGMSGAGLSLPEPFPSASSAALTREPPALAEAEFERGLREREREIESRAADARAWLKSTRQPALAAQVVEGDRTSLNVNAFDFCAKPSFVDARVVAVTDAAVILADETNPDGGFTDEEYRAIGRTIDTLVYPLDTAAFGAPTDIDRNGRVMILFSKAVNALTPRTSNSIALGFFYSRDLLPRQSTFGACSGSNAGEMFYVLVPDPMASVSGARSKVFVQNVVFATVAHEFQHLINASRRMYENDAFAVTEESWLNEGLSHVAEELLFYRASGLSPRQNLGGPALAEAKTRETFDQFQSANFRRYQEYLRIPDAASPLAENDLLSTRGASWAFLRYLADRAGPADGDIWRRVVNSKLIGVPNVDAVLAGTEISGGPLTVASALRDWSVAVITDDLVVPANGALVQPSWHFLSAFQQVGMSDWLTPPAIVSGANLQVLVRGGSSAYARFAAGAGQEALVQAGASSGAPIRGARFTIVRIK